MLAEGLDFVKEIIYSADLSPVLKRLVLIEGWKPKHAKLAIQQYRNYLFLKKNIALNTRKSNSPLLMKLMKSGMVIFYIQMIISTFVTRFLMSTSTTHHTMVKIKNYL